MANKRVSMLILFVLVFYIPSNAVANEESNVVPQFGARFALNTVQL